MRLTVFWCQSGKAILMAKALLLSVNDVKALSPEKGGWRGGDPPGLPQQQPHANIRIPEATPNPTGDVELSTPQFLTHNWKCWDGALILKRLR